MAVGFLFFEKIDFSFSGRLVWSAYGKSLRICSGWWPEKWKSNKIGFNGRIDLKIDTEVRNMDTNMFVKFCGDRYAIFRKNWIFCFQVGWLVKLAYGKSFTRVQWSVAKKMKIQ